MSKIEMFAFYGEPIFVPDLCQKYKSLMINQITSVKQFKLVVINSFIYVKG